MFVSYLRSSSIGTLGMCEMKYYLTYSLGFKDKTNKAAVKGTVMHRTLQCLADKVLAIKSGKKTVDFEGKRIKLDKCDDIEYISQLSFDYYTPMNPELVFTKKDFKDCVDWVNLAISYNKGSLDPRNQNVFATEQFFDFEVKEDWAKYSYDINGEKISGYLGIKGTIDLILAENNGFYQVLDYKSGQRKNWATGKKKEYADLEYDSQLLLYYYALKNLFPEKEFIVSIFYINDGGIYEFPFDREHYLAAENMLKQKFMYIKNVQIPRQVSTNPEHPTCKYMCAFSKSIEGSDKSICQHFYDQIKEKGIQEVTNKNINLKAVNSYTGGGRVDQ